MPTVRDYVNGNPQEMVGKHFWFPQDSMRDSMFYRVHAVEVRDGKVVLRTHDVNYGMIGAMSEGEHDLSECVGMLDFEETDLDRHFSAFDFGPAI